MFVSDEGVCVRFLPGIKTYACTMELDGKNPLLYDASSSMALLFASQFRKDFFYATREPIINGYHMYELRVMDVVDGKGARDLVRFLVFFKRLRKQRRMTGQEEEVSIIEWLKATVSNSSEWLNGTVSNSNETLETTPSVVPFTLAIRSTEMCFVDNTTHSAGLQSTLTWPATPIGGVAIPEQTCIQSDGQPAVRRCKGNFTVGAYWGDVQGTCERHTRSATLDLRNLSLEVVTKETTVPAADRLQNLTADSGSLAALDVLYVARTLENIVSAGSIGIQAAKGIVSTIDNVLKADSQVLKQSRSANSTNRMLAAMEDISAGLPTNTLVVRGSVALGKVFGAHPPQGIAFRHRDDKTYNFSDPMSLHESTDVAFMLSESASSAPLLTIGVTNSNGLLQDMTKAEGEDEHETSDENPDIVYDVCTPVFQVQYRTESDAAKMATKDSSFSFYLKQTCDTVPEDIECVFWDVNENEYLGAWSGNGCEYRGKVNGYHHCNCTHLTTFAVIFKYNRKNRYGGNLHDAILSYLTTIGVPISASGLLMVVLTYVFFKKWRKGTGHQILFNLCLSLLGALASFVALSALPKRRASLASCTCVGVALHYFLLVSFAWTFVEALLQYLRFVRVLGTYVPNLVLKAAFGAWGAPMVVILCVLIVNPMHYHKRKDFCWLEEEALLYSFLFPVGLVLAANVIVFCVIVFSIYCRRQKGLRSTQSQKALAEAQLRATVCIVFLLGLTWIFAYLSLIETVSKEWGRLFEYLFVITSSLQGLVIFIFHIAYEKTAREFWLGQIIYCVRPAKDVNMKLRAYVKDAVSHWRVQYFNIGSAVTWMPRFSSTTLQFHSHTSSQIMAGEATSVASPASFQNGPTKASPRLRHGP
ncbi:hypothetical protein V5799_013339 [Amblyomma americanum]|uniref:G-protein coupled receptors family 2 profile 2 domain-containing protein n=1 Tax=Amblyomma americanum TaxID=6943 RepID=A0AAQ4E675_AMBAM